VSSSRNLSGNAMSAALTVVYMLCRLEQIVETKNANSRARC
jgi:hypothetical protein